MNSNRIRVFVIRKLILLQINCYTVQCTVYMAHPYTVHVVNIDYFFLCAAISLKALKRK